MQCPICDGDGSVEFPVGEDPLRCFQCKGTGSLTLTEWTRWQWSRHRHYLLVECPACDGKGGHAEWVPGVPYGGPTYECEYCHGDALIIPWRWLKWHYWITNPPAPLWKIQQIMIWWKHGKWVR